jgi:hypothetical protein
VHQFAKTQSVWCDELVTSGLFLTTSSRALRLPSDPRWYSIDLGSKGGRAVFFLFGPTKKAKNRSATAPSFNAWSE